MLAAQPRASTRRAHLAYSRTLEEALAWCVVWFMAPKLDAGPFLI
jgi:hypothetical protein